MEMEQELEWIEAQKIGISVDLVAAAKLQLQFLEAVDRKRYLYEGTALLRAIYRLDANLFCSSSVQINAYEITKIKTPKYITIITAPMF